jgi:Fur family transcriptional regulator, ferric uptake regulator
MKSNEVKQLFQKEGLRFTSQRNLVFDIMSKHPRPLTADEIYFLYLEQDESISLSTIYRILELFLEKEIITKTLLTDNNKACYVLRHGHKHLLVCLNCKKITEVKECPVHYFEDDIQNATQFKITGHKLELYGLCPECQ